MSLYCTVLDIKQRLEISVDDYDSALTALASSVSAKIDDAFGWLPDSYAVTSNTTRYFDACAVCGPTLRLDVPLLTVSSITNGDTTAVTSGMYRLFPRNTDRKYEIHMLSGYSWQFVTDGEISVTGKFGYSLTVPPQVRETAIIYAGWLFKRYQAALQDATASADFGQLVMRDSAMPKQAVELMADVRNYRKML